MGDIKLLILDEDISRINIIIRFIQDKFKNIKCIYANNYNDGINLLKNEKPNIVISKYSITSNNNFQIINIIRNDNDLKNIYFITLVNTEDDINNIQLKNISIDDYCYSTISSDKVFFRINSAIRILNMQKQIRDENELLIQLAEQLEVEIQDTIKLAVKFLEARIPSTIDTLKKVAEASVWIAKSYNSLTTEQIRDLEIAAYLYQAGRIYLNDELLTTPIMVNGRPSNEFMYSVPKLGKEILSSIRRYEEVSKIVYHIYENFDGTGIPDQLKSWQIPYESRIIRVASDYNELKTIYKKTPGQAIEIIKSEAQRLYDHRVAILMEHYVKSNEKTEKNENEIAVNIIELKNGMTLTRDIYTEKGLKLIPSGAVLTASIIQKIVSHNTSDPILGNIYVKRF